MVESIASRTLKYSSPQGESGEAVIHITKPRPDKQDWSCSIHIAGIEKEVSRSVYGIDSLQCLVLAFGMMHARLDLLQKSGYRFFWLGKKGYGFETINDK